MMEREETRSYPGKPLKNAKWEKFCFEYLKDLNASQALIRTGYTPTNANVNAAKLLAKDSIKSRIEELKAHRMAAARIEIEDVVLGLKEVAQRCMKKKPVMKWDYELGQYVQETDEMGNDVWTFDSQGANKALELLGKHVGAFEKDNLQKAPIINVVVYDEEEEIEFITPIEIKDVDPDGTSGERKSNIQDSEKGVPTLLPPSSTK